jgi:hypothetical protein
MVALYGRSRPLMDPVKYRQLWAKAVDEDFDE